MDTYTIIAVLLVVLLVYRLIAGSLEGNRVKEYIGSQGGELLESKWSPFGRGWFGEKSDRIYEIRYRDRTGSLHEATVKTSMFSGVYLTEDRIVQPGNLSTPTLPDLERENARLRQRIAELEKRNPG
ncbi:MAG: hypothetical protein R2834_03925 [Rhodothermales bacterium]